MANLIQAEITNLLTNVKDYFLGQQELYGENLYLDYDPNTLSLLGEEKKKYWLGKLFYQIRNCQRCGLAQQRTRLVFGNGRANARIMLIGEAPGSNEDREGKPFVGNAGQLLDKILQAIQLSRPEIYVTNVVKCRPPENRDPLPEECQTCFPILKRQIEIIEPQFILLLGRVAARVMLNTEESIANIRGKIFELFGAKAVVTYHPAALLRNPELKRSTWEDVQLFQKLYQ